MFENSFFGTTVSISGDYIAIRDEYLGFLYYLDNNNFWILGDYGNIGSSYNSTIGELLLGQSVAASPTAVVFGIPYYDNDFEESGTVLINSIIEVCDKCDGEDCTLIPTYFPSKSAKPTHSLNPTITPIPTYYQSSFPVSQHFTFFMFVN